MSRSAKLRYFVFTIMSFSLIYCHHVVNLKCRHSEFNLFPCDLCVPKGFCYIVRREEQKAAAVDGIYKIPEIQGHLYVTQAFLIVDEMNNDFIRALLFNYIADDIRTVLQRDQRLSIKFLQIFQECQLK